MSIICASLNNSYLAHIFRADKLAATVSNFLRIFPVSAPVSDAADASNIYKRQSFVILAYGGQHDLQPYFPDFSFYKVPDECESVILE